MQCKPNISSMLCDQTKNQTREEKKKEKGKTPKLCQKLTILSVFAAFSFS